LGAERHRSCSSRQQKERQDGARENHILIVPGGGPPARPERTLAITARFASAASV
jgi:hypothetical protein